MSHHFEAEPSSFPCIKAGRSIPGSKNPPGTGPGPTARGPTNRPSYTIGKTIFTTFSLVSALAHPCLLANFLTLEICLSRFSLHKEKTSQTKNAHLGYRHTKSALYLLRENLVSPFAIDTSQSPGLKNSNGIFFF